MLLLLLLLLQYYYFTIILIPFLFLSSTIAIHRWQLLATRGRKKLMNLECSNTTMRTLINTVDPRGNNCYPWSNL